MTLYLVYTVKPFKVEFVTDDRGFAHEYKDYIKNQFGTTLKVKVLRGKQLLLKKK